MRAVQFDRYGPPDVLEVRSVPVPVPRPSEALVRVHASGLNPKDAVVRSGSLRLLTGRTFPRGTGDDFAGEIAATGERVWGFLDGFLGGAAAEYLAVPREWLAPMPERLDWIEAAALPLVATTALQALRDVARLGPGDRVLIKGASGGVGSAAIQIARAMGARVTALASGPGVEYCRALGADAVVDYRRSPPETLDEKFTVFLDCVGGSSPWRYRRLFARGGRWVAVAPEPLVYALTPLSWIVAPLVGGSRFGFVAVKPRRADLIEVARLVDLGQLRMPVQETFPLERIREAHAAVAQRHGRGKRVIVLSPRDAEP
jgi:NADPH:quinone reductase-like Zn-dependent oxidoreductase